MKRVFCTVARIEAIRLFLAFASYMGFLHLYNVVKALEWTSQAPRAWYARLSAFLLQHNYRRGTIDKTLFIKKDSRDILLVQVYVDDIIFGSTNKAWCEEFEVLMKGEFEMSVLWRDEDFLQVLQFDMESVRTATTPYEAAKTKLKDETDPPVNVHLYRSMIGSLMYLTASRPDIMFAVSACSRHQVTPLTSHLNAVKKIFKYLKGQPKLGLWYPKDTPFQLEAYSDSDYAGSHGDRKSTTGGCQFLGRRLISWQCKKQTIVATSSTEAEYVAAASCCGQVQKIHTDDNVRLSFTDIRHLDVIRRFEYSAWYHIGMVNPSFRELGGGNKPRGGFVFDTAARCTILPADRLVSAGSTMIQLHTSTGFCCAQFDIAGWLVSATSHLVSARQLEAAVVQAESHLVPPSPQVVPIYVSPATDWRPWPSVLVHSPIRDPTPEPESPPTPPSPTFSFEEPLVFGHEPRPAGYVDPDVIEPIILAHSPDPMIHPLHGGFHVESPVRPDDAPTPTADAAGRAEDPALLTGLSAKLDRVKKLEKTVKQLRETRLVVDASAAEGDVDIQDDIDLDGLSRMVSTTLEDAQARKCFEEEQASEQTDWLNLMMQVGSNPALARELLGADVNKENFIERMNAVKEKKRLEIGISLLSAQYNLFRPKPAITEPPSKRQRVERVSSQPASVPAATTLPADDPDSAGGGSSNPAGSATPMAGSAASNTAGGAFGATVTDSTVTTTAAMDSAGSRRKIGVSPFADSAAGPSPFLSSIAGGPSPSNVSTDQIPIAVLFESTSGDINEFFLESDEEEQIGMSRVVADPDSDDEVIAEIIFRGKSISGDGVVFVDKLPDDEIVDPRVKVETVSESASSPPRSRSKHLGVRSDDFLWDKPVEDFFRI
ncbi:putative ribonuclease H-like domain-containing protein [Tanacetum coccineum]|uniref:Ribonuclease H-like domain-containing protein n=1 Tax=Tanacetum coccineum TaxID=301880 RepID=A0ABQ5BU71_9ASTR